MTPSTSPLQQALARWRQAESHLKQRALKVDAEWAFVLLEKAKELPAWRGTAWLAASFFLPRMPDWAGATDTPTLVLFRLLGAGALGAAVWFLAKDGAKWGAWWRARRDLRAGHYQSRSLQSHLGLERSTDLVPVEKDGEQWAQMKTWAAHDPFLAGVWKRWNASGKPVRQGDIDALQEGVFAILEVKELKKKKA